MHDTLLLPPSGASQSAQTPTFYTLAVLERLTLFCVLCFALLCGQAKASESRLTLSGSSTVAPLVLEMAKRYEKLKPGVRIDVQTGGSSRGINDARMGSVDIGMVSRALKPSENDLSAYLIARDGISLILHRDNPLKALNHQQVLDIYTGKITNWQALGGENRSISVVNKAEGRSTLEVFLNYFQLRNSQIKAHVVIGDNQQGIKTVAGNPGAVAYVSIGSAEFEERRGIAIRRVSVAGFAASVEQVASGAYPLSRELNLVVGKMPTKLCRDFLSYTLLPALKTR